MSKKRYNIVRGALGFFVGVSIGQLFHGVDALSGGQWIALGFGIVAGIYSYWPEKNAEQTQTAA